MVEEQAYPAWLRPYLSADEVSAIEHAVARAEERTTGEIVPMIVSRSSAIGHVPFTMGLILTLIWFAAAVVLPRGLLTYWSVVGIFAVPLFALWLGRSNAVQRLLTASTDREYQVALRAELERLQAKMTTRRGTGILLFASLMERRAVVLADQGIAEKLPQETWQDVVRLLVGAMHDGQAAEGFISAIKRCEEILAEHFPIGPEDKNELANGLLIEA